MLFSAVALQVLVQFLRLIFYSMMTRRLSSLVRVTIEICKVRWGRLGGVGGRCALL